MRKVLKFVWQNMVMKLKNEYRPANLGSMEVSACKRYDPLTTSHARGKQVTQVEGQEKYIIFCHCACINCVRRLLLFIYCLKLFFTTVRAPVLQSVRTRL